MSERKKERKKKRKKDIVAQRKQVNKNKCKKQTDKLS